MKLNKLFVGLLLFFSIVGFLDATYLTIEHYRKVVPPCSVVSGCVTVLTSEYSTIGPVPVALLGSLYYGSVLFLTLLFIDSKKAAVAALLKKYSWAGLGASAYFVYLQLFVMHTICLYCMGSAASSTLLFVSAWLVQPFITSLPGAAPGGAPGGAA